MSSSHDSGGDPEVETLLRALVALQIDAREAALEPDRRRTEVILSDAGLSNVEIGKLTGRSADAVRMAISRARKAEKRG